MYQWVQHLQNWTSQSNTHRAMSSGLLHWFENHRFVENFINFDLILDLSLKYVCWLIYWGNWRYKTGNFSHCKLCVLGGQIRRSRHALVGTGINFVVRSRAPGSPSALWAETCQSIVCRSVSMVRWAFRFW